MKGRNVVIMVLVLFIVGLAEVGFVCWRIWNSKTQTAKVEAPIETVANITKEPEKSSTIIKREGLEEALIVELKEEIGDFGYKHYELSITTEDSEWIRGLLLAYHSEKGEPPTDPYEFLARKDTTGNIIDFAYVYSEKFTSWLDLVPENILPNKAKQFYRLETVAQELEESTTI